MNKTSEVLEERGKRYGVFMDHANITQALKCLMQGDLRNGAEFARRLDANQINSKYVSMSADQQESLEMIAHKIGRILNGDPDYSDSWRDIAGYAQLVADRLVSEGK